MVSAFHHFFAGASGAVLIAPTIALSASSIDEDASINDVVGTLSVSGGSGTYTFSITADPDSKFQIANDDELQLADTLDYETAASHSVTVQADNGVDDPIERTFSISVGDVEDAPWTPASLPNLVLWIDPSDTSTLFQSNAGTTAITADGQSVGYAGDKSGDGFHMTSAADDTTRPLYKTSGGLHWLEANGTSQYLRRMAALGVFANGGSIFTAHRSSGGAGRSLYNEAASGNALVLNWIRTNPGAAANGTVYLRNDANAEMALDSLVSTTNAFASGVDHVYGVTDDGAGNLVTYLDSATAFDSDSYTRGTCTPDRTSLFATLRSNVTSVWGGRLYQIVVCHGVISAGDRAKLITFLGSKAGLTL